MYEDAENWLDRNQIPVNQSNVGYQRKWLAIRLSDAGISDYFAYHFLTLDCETLPPTPVLSVEDADLRTFPKSSVVVAAAS